MVFIILIIKYKHLKNNTKTINKNKTQPYKNKILKKITIKNNNIIPKKKNKLKKNLKISKKL
jgi:hypothetical protein